MANQRAASGQQWTVQAYDQELVVVEVGGGIRSYRRNDNDVLWGYSPEAKADAGRGQHLFPWPNRIRDGKYEFGGRTQQLPLTEPARSNASHGLTRWANWQLVEQTGDGIVVGCLLLPQAGWDWQLELQVRYQLTPDGLVVTPSATNIGSDAAPFGYGAHPYLTAGEDSVDDLELHLPADTVIDVDDRLIPTGASPVPTAHDFRRPRRLGATSFDHAFTGLADTAPGRWEVTLRHGDRATTLWADADAYRYVQVFSGDSLPGNKNRRSGVAVEPMTCPANAFVTGEGLITLQPGQEWSAPWGVRSEG